ncbi:pgk2, partial [Cucurbita argyrosperma subsp. argyrosperma]
MDLQMYDKTGCRAFNPQGNVRLESGASLPYWWGVPEPELTGRIGASTFRSRGTSQSDLEANIFKLMELRGYGEEYINRYKMMTRIWCNPPWYCMLLTYVAKLYAIFSRFHHQRVPLVILVCGTACVGKSTIATQLAQRLNLPNVLQTDMVYELLRTSTDAPLTSTPVWARDFSSSEEFITEFCRECRIVRKGLAGDLKKAMKDGKPVIIEGIHLDPSIYLMDDESKTPANMSAKDTETNPLSTTSDNESAKQTKSGTCITCSPTKESEHNNQENEGLDSLEAVDMTGNSVRVTDETQNKGETDRSASVRKDKSGAEPIIIPIVFKMAEFDHKALLEEWISPRTFNDKYPLQGLIVVNISATTFPQTLDWLHGYILQCIEQGISPVSNGNARQSIEH